MKTILFVIFTLIASLTFAQKSMMQDMAIQETIKKGLIKTYNFEFAEATKIYQQVKVSYPDHPAYSFLMASQLYWEMLYNDNYKDKSAEYFSLLNQTLKQADVFLKKNSKDVEGLFFNMAAESSLALYYAERNETVKCMNHAKKAYSSMKEGFTLKAKYVDFYFSTGIYDYFVVEYPETHPTYKPFMVFFSKGDKSRGIEELEHCVKNGIFSSTESLHYLTNIYLKYENDCKKAVNYSEQLVKKYPNNYYFISRHLEGLIGTGRYKEAEQLSYKLYKTGKPTFIMRSYVFYGLLYEKHYKNVDEAIDYYLNALRKASELTQPVGDYLAFTYAGLGRCYYFKGNTQKAVEYYKKAQNYAEYRSTRNETNDFLKIHQ